MGVFFLFVCFFTKKLTFQGLYNCKLKNEMTLILKSFFWQKKNNNNNQSWQDGLGRLASLIQSFSLTRLRVVVAWPTSSNFHFLQFLKAPFPYRNAWPRSRGRYPHQRSEYRVTVVQCQASLLI